MQKDIQSLEDELDDQQQYSRRNCFLVHGIKEEFKEDVEGKVMEIFANKLEAGVSINDISRSHRIGRFDRNNANKGKTRPIIVRFSSYRQRKKVFDLKKKLKGQRITITENLTKKRLSLLKKCIEKFEKKNCWSLDGRIFVNTDLGKKVFTKEEDFCNFVGEE